MIISASRRTDMPAFYGKWFMNRLRAGEVFVRNPMNFYQVSRIPLSPENVDCIVFWTKNSKPFHKYLEEIDSLGYKYYFQYSITPYHKDIESNMQPKTEIIESFKELSIRLGKEKTILRYDPILLTEHYSINYHIKAFDRLCELLSDYTDKVIISFLDEYKKISKNFRDNILIDINEADMDKLAGEFSHIAKKYNLQIETCAEGIDLEKYNINHAKCIDGELIAKIIGVDIKNIGRDNQREHCGCLKCIDIGQYNTCIHDCLYCYANVNKSLVRENHKRHDPMSPILIGDIDIEKDNIVDRNEKDTRSIKLLKDANIKAYQGSIDELLGGE